MWAVHGQQGKDAMIAFGVAVTNPDIYQQYAERGINLVREPDTSLYPMVGSGSLFRNYNLILELASKHEDLEALVLVHQDAEIVDPDFCAKLRSALRDPEVGVVGCVGAVGVRSIAWWEGSATWGSFIHRYQELGGGDLPAFAWDNDDLHPSAWLGEVDTVDGFVLGLSPWTVRNVRFDESLGRLHGYDYDYCLQVRAAGRKVTTADFKAIHHHSLDLVSEPDTWMEAHMRVADKWDGRMPHVAEAPGDWKQRARRAEAEASVNMALAVSNQLKGDARVLQLRREIDVMQTSIGWRITEPLRRLNYWRRRLSRRARNDLDASPPPARSA
jgi:hypothetical protein